MNPALRGWKKQREIREGVWHEEVTTAQIIKRNPIPISGASSNKGGNKEYVNQKRRSRRRQRLKCVTVAIGNCASPGKGR